MSGLSKIRVYELAKEVGLQPAELLTQLQDLGVGAKSASSTIDDSEAELIRELLTGKPAEGVHEAVAVPSSIAVRDFADLVGVDVAAVQKHLLDIGIFAPVTQTISFQQAQQVATKLGIDIVQGEAKSAAPTPKPKAPKQKGPAKSAWTKPPVVTVLGHVDHGKTSLLDAIRNTRVVDGEFGGITQHIGAYQTVWEGKTITFIDTPGHEAFTAMRARGAQVTDVAVLVVAADDGVMPQTREAIDHAKAAEVPIVVALNKMDTEGANPDRVKQQLSEYGLVPEEWGGDTMVVPVSAKQRTGINDLLEGILLQAEMLELTADPSLDATGVVIEARLEKGRGAVTTILVQNGTLKVGNCIVAGSTSGKIKAMTDDKGQRVQKAGPATPVEIIGLDNVPSAGDAFEVVAGEKEARQMAMSRIEKNREQRLQANAKFNLQDFYKRLEQGETRELNVVLRCDVDGSAEAIRHKLNDQATDEVSVRVIQSAVGAVGESDVLLASASGAIVIAFNTRVEPEARAAAERERIEIREYNIIYELLEDVRKAMGGLLEPERREDISGHAEIRQIFKTPNGNIAGSYVLDGKITRGAFARVLRGGEVVHSGRIDSLRRFKEDTREVSSGFECGIHVEGFDSIQEGDIVEAFVIEEVARTL